MAALLAAAAAACAAGCGGHTGGARRVSLSVKGASGIADAPVRIDVRGLRAHGRATLRAAWTAFGGKRWTSSVPLHATAAGTVALRGVEGMRFLWGMHPAGPPTARAEGFAPPAVGASTVAVSVVAAGKIVARATLSRRVTPASVHVRKLTKRRDGIDGVLFTPPGGTRRAGAVVFGGSEGGNGMIDAAGLLAAHGYPTLALAYFGQPGLPPQLIRVPLEYFRRAVRALLREPGVDPARVVVMGTSRGGEAALLLASTFPGMIHGAVALVPSADVNQGPKDGDAAWTLRGKDVEAPEPIAVERISGPVLTVGAGDDLVWNSAAAVAEVQRRLADRHFRFAHEGLTYDRAGHLVGAAIPYLPAPTDQARYGGSVPADATAKADLWPRILRFFAGPLSR
jgi:dienelactone hydrolase